MESAINIHDYIASEVLYESKKSKIYKATHNLSNKSVIIKKLNKKYPSSYDIEFFNQEYEIAKNLSGIEGIGIYQQVQEGNSFYLIMDDFDGGSLGIALAKKPFELLNALEISVKIAETLSKIHDKNIIHKDVNPTNILWNSIDNNVRIIDFGISCHLSKDVNEVMVSHNFDGTLQYISPEQTGRMNLAVDYRTDLYSFGVTLYQLFLNKLPFVGDDAIELVHCHIAKSPEPLHQISKEIPKVLSDIVMKLIAKNPDDRYQSAKGLVYDLDRCLSQYSISGNIDDFEIGRYDHSGKFHIPHKLYGMEKELESLTESFERTRKGKNVLVLVSGYSGIGKSLLVNELHKPVLNKNGFFIKGKFDQYKNNIPLFGFTQAFNDLLVEILSSPEKKLYEWKSLFASILGPNGRILTDIVPELERLLGKQPELQSLNPSEAQNRFLMIFRNFLKGIATKDHPMVLFLDDIQWSDPLSTELIKDIALKDIPYLMLICTKRKNDAANDRFINFTFDEIGRQRNYKKLDISSLNLDSVSDLVADTLRASISDVEELSEVIYSKTNGNPFFTKEFLKSLHKDGLLSFNINTNKWQWNLDKIRDTNISDNLLEIIKDRINKLPADSINILKVASCIGNSFDLKTIASVANAPLIEVSQSLLYALDEGIINVLGNRLKVLSNNGSEGANIQYRFQHYRIQQVLSAFISEEELKEIHFEIGKYYQDNLDEGLQNDKIIEIANHFNYGIDLVDNQTDKTDFALFYLNAAEKALSSSAFSSALVFYDKGVSLLSDNAWDEEYSLCYELYKGVALCSYQVGKYKEAELCIDNILSNTKSKLDKVSVITIRLRHYATLGKPHEAIAEGIKGLGLLGVKISEKPSMLKVMFELLTAKILQGKRKTADLINLPLLEDPKKRMIARLLTEMGAPAYTLGNDSLYGVLALKVVNLSLKHGYTPEMPYALVAYGMLLSVAIGNLKAGNEYAKLAINLNEKHNDLEYRCRVIAAYGVLTFHWNNHWSKLTGLYKKGIEAGIHSGDIFYLAHSAGNCVIWDPKLNIQTQIEEHQKYMALIRETGFADAIDTAEMRLQLLSNYRGNTIDRYSLSDKFFNEERRLNEMTERKYVSGLAMFHIAKAEIFLYNGKPKQSYKHIIQADNLSKSLVGLNYTYILSVLAFHSASQCFDAGEGKRKNNNEYLARMKKELKKLKKWAKHNPDNYLHQYQLMKAEILRHKGNNNLASTLYIDAINNANKNFWLKDEAFCHEITANYFEKENLKIAATGHLRHARYLYNRIGASTKVQQLEEQFPEISESKLLTDTFNTSITRSMSNASHSTSGNSIDFLDMNTITKASQTISGEIVFETLLRKLLQITVENAGAQRGVLILSQNKTLKIQAEYSVEQNQFILVESVSVSDYTTLPESLINYVANSKRSVVLSDALYEGMFTQDPYILKNKTKSILAEPIIKQSKLDGIIYLENNLNIGVFSDERQQLLKILSTQIAISIENARMFENLEEKIKERTKEILDANQLLSDRNTQINQQKEELEKLNASKDKMYSIIAHDLKSPFNAILGLADLLATSINDYDKPEIEELAKGIYNAGSRVFNLLENLLNWAMSQSGNTKFIPAHLSLRSIVNDVFDILKENIQSKNISVKAIFDTDIRVFADKHMLYAILRNLVSNALKYCNPDGNIQVSAKSDKNEITVSVVDDGVGIDEERVKKLFIINEETSTPGTKNEKGTGLGLILCKEFIERHNGKIWVESEEGKGCRFYFTLPVH